MRECPTCQKDKVDDSGRCTNTTCSLYSAKVMGAVDEQGFLKCDGYDVRCESMNATRRRQNTAYEEDESNWNTLCEDCQVEVDEHWADMWNEYWSSVL